MIIVWNSYKGATYGFPTLEDYKEFAKENQEYYIRDCWNDYVYDVGDEGGCTDDCEPLDMLKFNLECSGD
jgi:hypothetical protein